MCGTVTLTSFSLMVPTTHTHPNFLFTIYSCCRSEQGQARGDDAASPRVDPGSPRALRALYDHVRRVHAASPLPLLWQARMPRVFSEQAACAFRQRSWQQWGDRRGWLRGRVDAPGVPRLRAKHRRAPRARVGGGEDTGSAAPGPAGRIPAGIVRGILALGRNGGGHAWQHQRPGCQQLTVCGLWRGLMGPESRGVPRIL